MSKPIRVLQVFALMNRGGAETMIMNLYRNIDRTKVQFDFIVHTNKACAYDDEIKNLGGKIYRVPRYNGKNHLQYKRAWNKFFQEHPEYKIIHGHVRSTAAIYLRIAKKYGLITIAHSHSTSSGNGFSAIVKKVLQYPIRYTADYLFACSKSAGEWLFGKKACKGDNFFVFKNAIDAKKFIYNKEIRERKRKELHIENKFVIGHIGRFHLSKNHTFLIDVFKEIYDRNENSVLVLVGDGELRSSIEKKVNDLRLSGSVIFTGVRSDVPQLLQAMDVFVFPSLYEGLPVTVVEAQAAGLPCFVTEAIPREAYLTDHVYSISYKQSAKHWANEILKYYILFKRKNSLSQIKSQGYDVLSTAKAIEDFYFQIIN